VVQATAAPAAEALDAFAPRHDFFVGVDSDGCAFDAMEIKHKECFTPSTIKHWRLQAVSSAARETAEFVNLYSTHRGLNRWRALVEVFDLLRERPEPARRGVTVPSGDALRAFIASGLPLSNAGLRAYAAEHPDPELDAALRWTEGVDAAIADMVTGVPPFAGVRETLARARDLADVMVVSATPVEALEREWGEHGLAALVDLIAGQEMGTKEDHLRRAAVGRYDSDRVLLVGDAPGDRAAAQTSGVLFYPIVPGREDESWLRLHDEALDRFFAGTYAGAYADALAAEFAAVLPSTPPWQQR
jgi:phosphoglycolate phosphatase-like HAD superfamily hydrolase